MSDPLENPEYRDALAEAGEWGVLVAWVVGSVRAEGARRPARLSADWSATSRAVAFKVDELTKGWPDRERKRAFREAYPFGQRKNFPYRAWLAAVATAQGRKLAKRRRKGVGIIATQIPRDPTRSMFE